MADRIFPSTKQDSLGSEKQINTIDWEKFAQDFHVTTTAAVAEDDSTTDREAKRALPQAFLDNIQKMKDKHKKKDEGGNKSEDDDKDSDDDKGSDDADAEAKFVAGDEEKKEASNKNRKIVFSNPGQISAEALIAAKTAGDSLMVRAITAAREQRNRMIEAQIEKLAETEMSKDEKLAKRSDYRMKVVANTERVAKRVAAVDKSQDGFKTVSAMNIAEKRVAADRMLANGFPQEYIDVMLDLNQVVASVSSEENQIREVMSSSISDSTKKIAIASLVKTAELSAEQIKRCEDYWINELGYDAEWVKDLFSSKYDK